MYEFIYIPAMPRDITITMCIGRNVGAVPMSDTAWNAFIADAHALVVGQLRAPWSAYAAGDVPAPPDAVPFVTTTYGTSTWEGVEEETCTLVATGIDSDEHEAIVENRTEVQRDMGLGLEDADLTPLDILRLVPFDFMSETVENVRCALEGRLPGLCALYSQDAIFYAVARHGEDAGLGGQR